jgi:hypothetical protein
MTEAEAHRAAIQHTDTAVTALMQWVPLGLNTSSRDESERRNPALQPAAQAATKTCVVRPSW